ncbi:hypothetical protein CEV31_2897 [Brucella thiophenivorans]|uniref:Uncharacterized protein n=1 Tax=Brucella thiophenivorans TaxID=571255 RepID=A0A256FJS6_9HYPH|nr:hypothetical protein CEV31_2897 [Brucella thiophenivorans]
MIPPGQKLALQGTNEWPNADGCAQLIFIGAIYCDCRIC